MPSSPPLPAAEHQRRASRHTTVGRALDDAGDEWAGVVYSYAAYLLVKAALLNDPLWSDVSAMHGKHHDLVRDDRLTTRHHGRKRT